VPTAGQTVHFGASVEGVKYSIDEYSATKVKLTMIENPGATHVIEKNFSDGPVVICGKAFDPSLINSVLVNAKGVSGTHCHIQKDVGVKDVSSNGTQYSIKTQEESAKNR
jgi:hypothetical protein